jgi:hypothetical protein
MEIKSKNSVLPFAAVTFIYFVVGYSSIYFQYVAQTILLQYISEQNGG